MKLLKCFNFGRLARFAYQTALEGGQGSKAQVSKVDQQEARAIAHRTDERFLPGVKDLEEGRQDIVDAAVLALKDKNFQKKNPIAYEKIRSLYTKVMQGHRIDSNRTQINQSYIDSSGSADPGRGNTLTEVERRDVQKAASDLYLTLLSNGKFLDANGDPRLMKKDPEEPVTKPKPPEPENPDKRTPEQKFDDAFAKIRLEFGNHEQTQLYLDMRKHILDAKGQDNPHVHAQVVYDYIAGRLKQLTEEEKQSLFRYQSKEQYDGRKEMLNKMDFVFNGITTSIRFETGERGQLNFRVNSYKPSSVINPFSKAENVSIFHPDADFTRVDKPKAPDKTSEEPMFIDVKEVVAKIMPDASGWATDKYDTYQQQRYKAIVDQIKDSGRSGKPDVHSKIFYDYIKAEFDPLSPREKQVLAGQNISYSFDGVKTEVKFVVKGEESELKVNSSKY